MIPLLIGTAVAGLVIAMLLAPLETLGWWAGWYGEGLEQPDEASEAPYTEVGGGKQARHYVIFLDGIAKVGAVNYDDVQALLDGISEALPRAVVLGDVMPYSVRNLALTEGRPLGRFWRYAFRLKLEGRYPLLAFSINVRNLFQVLVAADNRYGPIYGQGEAQVMANSLLRYGYVPGSGTPVTLIGYSGGAQVAVVAAPFLARALGAPLSLISLGGVMGSGPGLADFGRVYHLQGSKDVVPHLGRFLFPGRWPIFAHSHWNRMLRQGKLETIPTGPMTHNGAGSYLDETRFLDGKSFLAHTKEHIIALVRRIDEDARSQAGSPA